jgi:hypothetical protein
MYPGPPGITSKWNPLLAIIAVAWLLYGVFQAVVDGAN